MADAIIGTATVDELAAASQVAGHALIAQVLREAQPYIEALRGRTLVIKLGGSALDNLVKGAAGQAIQCANLMYGLEETAGLPCEGVYP